MLNWQDRLRAASIHLGLSLGIAALAAVLVFGIWYPYPYREISGGRELFVIVVTVDVVLGPLITLLIFNRAKPWETLRRDLAAVGLIQLAGLAYGLWAVFVARPVHLVFEYSRFRVVHAVDVPADLLDRTPVNLQALPLWGPTLLSLRPFRSSQEEMDATQLALQGLSLSARPDLWQSYEAGRGDILKEAKPVGELKTRFPDRAGEIDWTLASIGRPGDSLVYLPLVGRKAAWTVLLDRVTAQVLGYLPIDPF